MEKAKKSKIKKIIYSVFLAFLIFTALLVIASAFPITGNYKLLVVESGSMDPNIKMGSLVMIKPMDEYKAGEVITFKESGKKDKTITHRIEDLIVTAGEIRYRTKGDANEDIDPGEVGKKEIVGKVLFSIPFAGYAVNFAQKPVGFALIIIIPAALIIFDEVKKIYWEIKKKKINPVK
jgi:signal peptidase I